jgi:hypothetical protein
MRADGGLELGNELSVTAQAEVGLDALLERLQPQLLEARDLGLSERLVGEVGQRRTAPQRERLPEFRCRALRIAVSQPAPAVREQLVEPFRVKLAWHQFQRVATALRDQAAVSDHPAQLRDVDVDAVQCAGRRRLAPQRVDQPVGRNGVTGVDEQDGQQRPLLASAERELAGPIAHLKRPEYTELHSAPLLHAETMRFSRPIQAILKAPIGPSGACIRRTRCAGGS